MLLGMGPLGFWSQKNVEGGAVALRISGVARNKNLLHGAGTVEIGDFFEWAAPTGFRGLLIGVFAQTHILPGRNEIAEE